MNYTTTLFVRLSERETGQTMTEYVLILAAIAIAGMVAYSALGTSITAEITYVQGQL